MESTNLQQNIIPTKRKKTLGGLTLLFVVLGLLWFAYWFFGLRLTESTDDAYVAGNLAPIAPQVSGSVVRILADNTEYVTAGQILVQLDPTDADIAVAKAKTNLAEAVRKIHNLNGTVARLNSLIEQRQRELTRVKGDLARRISTRTSRAVSEEELSHAHDAVAVFSAALRVAEQDLNATKALLHDTPVDQQPSVLLCVQQLREAWLTRKRCDILSPVTGYIAKRSTQLGARVTPGTLLMAVVPLHDVWIDANFKEVQIDRMKIGQPVVVTADAYGSRVTYQGRVAGLGAGTGSVFSLLPPENATGNWIKVVQRLPVKITLTNSSPLEEFPLRIGLSCAVHIAVGKDEAVSEPVKITTQTQYTTNIFNYDTAEIDKEVAEIIANNAPIPSPAQQTR